MLPVCLCRSWRDLQRLCPNALLIMGLMDISPSVGLRTLGAFVKSHSTPLQVTAPANRSSSLKITSTDACRVAATQGRSVKEKIMPRSLKSSTSQRDKPVPIAKAASAKRSAPASLPSAAAKRCTTTALMTSAPAKIFATALLSSLQQPAG